MPLRNSTFISFRHGAWELTKEFIDQFHHGLSGEVEAQLGNGVGRVFLDQDRLQAGDLFNEEIATELCSSATMVLVYTPSYFDIERSYCAREYKAMVALEASRLAALQAGERRKGLIIPVILRGAAHLPAEIRDNRQYHSFQEFSLCHRNLSRHKKYAPVLRELGEYIAGRFRALSGLRGDVFNCDNYALPSTASIKTWLESVVPAAPPLPGRSL